MLQLQQLSFSLSVALGVHKSFTTECLCFTLEAFLLWSGITVGRSGQHSAHHHKKTP